MQYRPGPYEGLLAPALVNGLSLLPGRVGALFGAAEIQAVKMSRCGRMSSCGHSLGRLILAAADPLAGGSCGTNGHPLELTIEYQADPESLPGLRGGRAGTSSLTAAIPALRTKFR